MAPQLDPAEDAAPEPVVASEPAAAPAAAPPPAIDPNVIALAQMLLQGQRDLNAETVKAQADIYAASMKTALKPENTDPPLISDFNPQGDRDFPRPALRYPFTMNGAEMPEYLMTVEEITLLNQLEPGHYRVTKTDDTQVIVSVVPTHDTATGAITKMRLVSKFGNKSNPEDKNNWPPQRVWLAEMLGVPAPNRPTPRQPTGRIAAPMLGAGAATNGVITGSLEAHMGSLGPIRHEVEAMLARDTSPMAPETA